MIQTRSLLRPQLT